MTDPMVPEAVAALFELFEGELADVKFPDVDGEVLRRAGEAVRERAAAVAEAEARLERAREELGSAQEALTSRAGRALAYARVYAEERPELLARLDAIHLPRPPRRGRAEAEPTPPSATPRRRGRAARAAEASAPLPLEAQGTPAAA